MSDHYENATTAIEATNAIMRDPGQAAETKMQNALVTAQVATAEAILAVADQLRQAR